MDDSFFERPILNAPYSDPARHWELDEDGQPTNRVRESRRPCELITPVPQPQRRRRAPTQPELAIGRDEGLSTPEQQYEVTRSSMIFGGMSKTGAICRTRTNGR
jgi:type III restriction enzyme